MDKKQLVCAPPDPPSPHQHFAPCTPKKSDALLRSQEIDRLSRFIYVHSADTGRGRELGVVHLSRWQDNWI